MIPFFTVFTAYHVIPCLWHLTGTKHFYFMPTGSASLLAYSQWSVVVSPIESSSPGVLSSLSGQTWWWVDHLLEKHGMHRQLQIHCNLLCHAVACLAHLPSRDGQLIHHGCNFHGSCCLTCSHSPSSWVRTPPSSPLNTNHHRVCPESMFDFHLFSYTIVSFFKVEEIAPGVVDFKVPQTLLAPWTFSLPISGRQAIWFPPTNFWDEVGTVPSLDTRRAGWDMAPAPFPWYLSWHVDEGSCKWPYLKSSVWNTTPTSP